MENENRFFLRLAYQWALQSDDLNTQAGAVLVQQGIRCGGYNRIPGGVHPHPDRLRRPNKYPWMEHAERVAIFNAARSGIRTLGATLYAPFIACPPCARAIVEAGILRVVAHHQCMQRTPVRWWEEIRIGDQILDEAGVERVYFDGSIGGVTNFFNDQSWNP